MRGWKVISFEQFSAMCNDKDCGDYETFCLRDTPDACGWINHCSAAFCPLWRKIGRADIKVEKITAHNTQSKYASPM
jgi:hypothetical protein